MARLDTHWHGNPKVLALGLAAMGLHAWSISYCDGELTDGFVPEAALPHLPGITQAVKLLVEHGRWEAVAGGYQLHDYLEYNRSRTAVLTKRAQDRERKAAPDSARNREGIAAESRRIPSHARPPVPVPVPGIALQAIPVNPQTPLGDADAQGPTGTASAPSQAQTCPMCNRVFIGSYSEHRCEISRPSARPGNLGKLFGRRSDISSEELDRVERELAEYRNSLAASPVESTSAAEN